MTNTDEALQKVLPSNFKSPSIINTATLINVGSDFFSSHSPQGLSCQTDLVAEHRSTDLETYFNGLLKAGVPPDVVEAQRARSQHPNA